MSPTSTRRRSGRSSTIAGRTSSSRASTRACEYTHTALVATVPRQPRRRQLRPQLQLVGPVQRLPHGRSVRQRRPRHPHDGDDGRRRRRSRYQPGRRRASRPVDRRRKGCETNNCTDFALLSSAQFILAPTDLSGNNPDPTKRPDIVNNSWGDAARRSVLPRRGGRVGRRRHLPGLLERERRAGLRHRRVAGGLRERLWHRRVRHQPRDRGLLQPWARRRSTAASSRTSLPPV